MVWFHGSFIWDKMLSFPEPWSRHLEMECKTLLLKIILWLRDIGLLSRDT